MIQEGSVVLEVPTEQSTVIHGIGLLLDVESD